jgi:hypothetical protein
VLLENKLGLDGIELMQAEERISKRKAKQLYGGLLDDIEKGTYAGLQAIHRICLRKYTIMPVRRAG